MARKASVFSRELVLVAIRDSFPKLDPREQVRNPVMFIVELGSVITTVIFFLELARGQTDQLWFVGVIAFWLWLTVLFANFAEAIAEGRGKAQANALRATRHTTTAHRRSDTGGVEDIPAPELQKGDVVIVSAGEIIPADGEIIEGVGSVDESAITGESAPVIRESGGDRSAVTGGTKLLSDQLVVLVTQEPGKSFLDRMIALVEGAERRKTPNEIALNILLAGLTITFLAAVVTLRPFAIYAGTPTSQTVLIALLVALIPTTIGALLSAIGIAGMDRMVQRNVLATSGRAVEAAGDVDVLLLDKTGTITLGNRQASEFVPVDGVTRVRARRGRAALVARRRDPGRTFDRGARQGPLRTARPRALRARRELHPVLGDHAHERRRPRRQAAPQGRRRCDQALRARAGRPYARAPRRRGRQDRPGRRHAARRRPGQLRARRHPPEGHRQGRHGRALRRAQEDGNPHGDDHRRQPCHGGRDRRGGRRRRLPRRGDARGEDGADQGASRPPDEWSR